MTPAAVPRAATRPTSGRRRRTAPALLMAGALALVLLLAAASLLIGNQLISPARVLAVLMDHDGSEADAVINGLRLPRTLLLLMIGVALGMSGALMQGYTRNPLADPGLLGVQAGAALAVVLGIFVFGVRGALGYGWFALVGSGLAAWAVFALGSTRKGPNPTSLVLAGAAVSALCSSITAAVITSSATTLNAFRFWAVGSASGRGLPVLWQTLPFVAAGILLAAWAARGVNLLQLGDDVATALGLNPGRQKLIGVVAIMLLCGGAVAACGPVAFVGLMVPHAARALVGVDYRLVVPVSGLLGAVAVTVADILGRVIAGGAEVAVGIVMALVGGPVFVLLVRRRRSLTT